MKPLDESVAAVRAVIAAGEAEGVPFVLNARTDALIKGGKRPLEESIADAIERGRAYLAEGATTVFVPGILNADVTRRLVEGIGERKVSVIGLPGSLTAAEYEALGVARISYGPLPQRVALTALKRVALDLMDGRRHPGRHRGAQLGRRTAAARGGRTRRASRVDAPLLGLLAAGGLELGRGHHHARSRRAAPAAGANVAAPKRALTRSVSSSTPVTM